MYVCVCVCDSMVKLIYNYIFHISFVLQKRNEPSNICISCEYIAKIKKLDLETVASVIFENTLKLFPKVRHFVK